MLVVSKPVTPAPLLPYDGMNTPPSSLSQTHLYYGQLAQNLIIKIFVAILKIV